MAARWEYLRVRWHYQRLDPPDPNEESAEWASKWVTEIRWPGSMDAEVVATEIWTWRRGMSEWEKTQKARIDVHGLSNELGADGWECYSVQTMASGAVPQIGFEARSHPLDVHYYFKRGTDG